MKHTDLDRAFRQTPSEFTQRVDLTLERLEEEKPVKKITIRTILVTALIVLLLCSVAYAVVTQGQQWYYDNRNTSIKEHSPEKYQAIMDSLQTDLKQGEANNQYVDVSILDVAWLPEEELMTLSIGASAKEGAGIELYTMGSLDTDGAYMGKDYVPELDEDGNPIDEEARNEHYLWTPSGYGPPAEVMRDPSKQLMLFEASEVFIGTAQGVEETLAQRLLGNYEPSVDGAEIPRSSYDDFVMEDGSVMSVVDLKLTFLADDLDARLTELFGEDAELFAADYRATREAYDKHVDADGMLTLFIPYTVTEYQEGDDQALYTGGVTELLSVKVKVREK